jgi:hypothetical protein
MKTSNVYRCAAALACLFIALPALATDYYVAITGNDSADGLTVTTAWRTLSKALRSGGMPNGTIANTNTLHVQPGLYENESTGLAVGSGKTNWFLDLSNKQFINIIGAGPDKTILAPGTKTLHVTIANDGMPERPLFKIFNAKAVRVSGFKIDGTTPAAQTRGEGFPNHSAIIGINGGEGIRIDNMYLDGRYTGLVWNTTTSVWQSSWQGFWYHGMCINGVIGPAGVMIDHVLSRGFVRSVYNNNWGYRDSIANTNFVVIDHCTFLENVCVSDVTQVANIRVISSEYGPSFTIRNCIIANHPWSLFPHASNAEGLLASAMSSMSNPDFTVRSQNNQFYAVGKPIPGNSFKNANVIDDYPVYTDYENEEPVFTDHNGLPYSTDRNTLYGFRDVGWNPFGEAPPDPLVAVTTIDLGLWKTNGTVAIVNNGGSNFPYRIATSNVWIKFAAAVTSGVVSTTANVPFTVTRAGLTPGAHSATIYVFCGDLATFAVTVLMEVPHAGIPYVYGLHVTEVVADGNGNKYYQDTMIENTTPNASFDSRVDVGVVSGFYTFGNSAFTAADPYLAARISSSASAAYANKGSFKPPPTNLPNSVVALADSYPILNRVVDNGTAPAVAQNLAGYITAAGLRKTHLNMPLHEGYNRFTLLCPAAGEIETSGLVGLYLLEGGTQPNFTPGALPTIAGVDDDVLTGEYDAIHLESCGFVAGDATYHQRATNVFEHHTLNAVVGMYEVTLTYVNIAGHNDPGVNPLGMTGPACVGYVCDYLEEDYNNQWAIRPSGEHAIGYLELYVEQLPEPVAGVALLLFVAVRRKALFGRGT